ncbi:tyrosine--tRNA ligase [Candidatus Woesearchaeota archaeon]|nr:tyrosine--tRNA ligase [Candidatus Woesearchaeota archaeon]
MNIDQKLELIKRNTQEIITEEELKTLLTKKKTPVVYIGTAVTGRPHIGYFVWAIKIADFIKAGFKAKILLADIHGALDNTPWPLLEKRYEYYENVITGLFEAIGSDLSKLTFVKGSDFQLKKDYVFDVLKVATFVTVHDCLKSSSDVVKHGDNPKLAGLIYPIMQALDEEYLGVDIQYGGVDQRKILVFARENLPKVGYKSRVEVMTPLIPGLTPGGKMSSSIKGSKVDLIDLPEEVKNKIGSAHCEAGVVEGNGVLAFLKYVVMVLKQDKGEEFLIERPEKFGGNKAYKTYEEIEKDYLEKKLHPMDLKNSLAKETNKLLDVIRKRFEGKEQLIKDAYPE